MDIAVIMGSQSDLPVVMKMVDALNEFNVKSYVRVLSAHRTPLQLYEFMVDAQDNGVKLFIAAAGGAAHLAGVIASHTIKPVIGLPIKSEFNSGLDSLLSICQMPSGVPVATVAVNGAVNAALLAVQMLAINNEDLTTKLKDHRVRLRDKTISADKDLSEKLSMIQ